MRASTWATVIAVVVIIAIGWWLVDWTGDRQAQDDPVPAAPTTATTDEPTTAPPAMNATQDPPAQVTTPEQREQQTIGESAPEPPSRTTTLD